VIKITITIPTTVFYVGVAGGNKQRVTNLLCSYLLVAP